MPKATKSKRMVGLVIPFFCLIWCGLVWKSIYLWLRSRMQSTPFFVFEAIFAWWRTNIQPTKQTTRWTKSKSALYRLEGMQSFAINVLQLDQPCIYNDLVLLKMSRCLYATQIVVIRRGWNRNWARKKRKKTTIQPVFFCFVVFFHESWYCCIHQLCCVVSERWAVVI